MSGRVDEQPEHRNDPDHPDFPDQPDHPDFLDEEDVAHLLGGAAVVRDRALLRSALGRPRASAFGADAYPGVWAKAVALGESVMRNHPMTDRNKRTGFESMLLFLDYNGQPYADPHPDDAVAFVLRLAQGGYAGRFEEAVADFRRILGASGPEGRARVTRR